jgi:molybdopterin converting factor small subunit
MSGVASQEARLPSASAAVYRGPLRHAAGPLISSTMPAVSVQYFAILRECAGRDREQLQTSAASAGALFEELAARYRFPRLPRLKVAINDEFRDWDAPLADGDRVVFIPPVAGG